MALEHIGNIYEIVRYPVKSMRGIPVDSAFLGWHGIKGDRRFAFRRAGDDSGFPWLSASRLPGLLLYQPIGLIDNSGEPLPTHVHKPDGTTFEIGSNTLNDEISSLFGSPVELVKLNHGIFDEAAISVINLATIAGIGHKLGMNADRRRFRANIFVKTENEEMYSEDSWVGKRLVFGESEKGPAVNVTLRDERCMMINLDPDTAKQDARFMKTVVQLNNNYAGIYATVVRTGTLHVGDRVSLFPE